MDEVQLTAIAQAANGVRMPTELVATYQGAVSANNDRVAGAALARLGVDRPPVWFDSFRAAHVRAGDRE